MVRLLHERGTTLARLRPLFGIGEAQRRVPAAHKPANDETSPTTDDDRGDPGEDERDDGSAPRHRCAVLLPAVGHESAATALVAAPK